MLRNKIQEGLKAAMHAKDEVNVATIRLMISAMKDKDIAARSKGNKDGIGDDEILSMLQGMIKQRRESITMYEKGGRKDLVDREQAEIGVIEKFLPKQMDEKEVDAAIAEAIKSSGAASIRDMGKVIGALKGKYAGQMDFSKVSGQVKEKLAVLG